jgi:hypothetical protein
MGMDLAVTFPAGGTPTWDAVRDRLAGGGFPAQVRMIDGELALPDEAPPASWRELRVSTPQGMVTLRREADGIRAVTWGNADAALRQAWNAVAWACAAAGGGRVVTAAGPVSAEEFRRSADLPAALRGA